MDQKQEKLPTKNKNSKIVAIVIACLVVVAAAIFLFLNLTKPTAKTALTTAAKTNITSARSTIVVTNKASKKTQIGTMNYEFNKDYIHISSKFKPKSAGEEQELWSTPKRVYNKDKNGKWQYMAKSGLAQGVFDQMFDSYNKLFTAHHFNRFSNKAFSALKVNLDGLGGYTVTYQGNDKDVLEGLQKASTVSGTGEEVDISQIKNVDLAIKVNRKNQLREMNYTVTYKNNQGNVSVHLFDINGVNNLQTPSELKKATRVTASNIED
ncbi:hypothetical protein [Lactobacillus hominis]|uniref:Uncharacterized protein n=1 Tax=Lactobacillus hominis DSM 23910 = CRBIP 24.179 TaxID=1423758 RepID=I7L9G8_9LACO|nr:hypothetical protein [Lactobacillus hominis]KRM85227.1 hypothetical protein FC41_GL001208 [Lactobacillus hominis DSM 23910 = CRBIP 24.179]MCT3347694.1 hypothetical protein [Lactobacillus hominis]CCI81359.1 Putative uncharacterized protein [Lactobacillus hominis DSM 23910 = CRBIP 24.179]